MTVPAHKDVDKEGNEIDVPETVVTKDDGPRPGTTMEKLAALKPVFKEGGTVTAGNACPLNDGAAALLVMTEEKAQRARPQAQSAASSPRRSRRSARRSWASARSRRSRQLLKNTGMSIERHRRGRDQRGVRRADRALHGGARASTDEKLNPFGGAIALGHPFGMTGARIMTTLLNDLETLDGTYGIESMCVAGGMGMAMLVERL